MLSLSYLASAVGAYFFPGPTRSFLVRIASAPYALGWFCLIGAIYFPAQALPLVVVGGGLLGLGSAGFYMLRQRLFASQDADEGNRNLLVGTAYAALVYFALYLIPQAVTALVIPLVFLPLFGLSVALKSREISRDQPIFQDIPREHPRVYRRPLHDHWKSALSVGVIGFCSGIMRSLAVADPQVGTLVNVISMGSMMIAALALGFVWHYRDIRLNVNTIYRVAFPFLITSFLLLPLLPSDYECWLAAALYAIYSAAIVLPMIQCAQIARDRGVNPVFVYGFFGTVIYALHDLGFIAGTFTENISIIGLSPIGTVTLVAVYLLGLMHFIGGGVFGRALASADGSIELVSLSRTTLAQKRVSSNARSKEAPHSAREPSPQPSRTFETRIAGSAADRISVQAQALREHYRLSARETEIMELIDLIDAFEAE